MPEGPECTIQAEGLNDICQNRVLTNVEVLSGRYTRTPIVNLDKITNQKIIKISNKGKFIYWVFDNGFNLFSTLGMSGVYLTTQGTHSRVRFTLDKNLDVWYNDVRNFGTMKVATQAELAQKLSEIGPDMLNSPCSYNEFDRIFSNKRIANKNLACFLLDQKRLSGIGNIYKSEICYRAAVNPSRTLSSFSEAEKLRIYSNIPIVLKLAYAAKGSSQKDFKNVDGEDGRFLNAHAQVYRKTQDPLGNPVLQAELGDGRTTWWVPEVQK